IGWCPDILRDAGLSSGTAGAMLSISMLAGIPPSLVAPVIMQRLRTQSAVVLAAAVPWMLGITGLLADPAGPTWVWMLLVGIGQGSGISMVLTLVVLRARDAGAAASLSGMAQGVGYVVAALGPLALGA